MYCTHVARAASRRAAETELALQQVLVTAMSILSLLYGSASCVSSHMHERPRD
jgi:hypothetical protein